jgi:enoyl-[acyl-carrier protein] reductase I
MIDNTGKTAVIFGVRDSFSISWAVAEALHKSGCGVACTYLPDTKDSVLKLMQGAGMDLSLTGLVDVTDESQVSSFASEISSKLGGVDYLLHGVAYGSSKVLCTLYPGETGDKPEYIDIPFEDLAMAMEISAYSLLRICRAFNAYLKDKQSSVVALTYGASQRLVSNYAGMAICKAALENIALYLADYYGDRGIRVNCLSPGMIMTSSSGGIQGIRKMRKKSKEHSILGNVKPKDVAGGALYLFSDLSRKVTGETIHIDGGINKVMVSKNSV